MALRFTTVRNAAAVLLLVSFGCGRSLPPAADPEQARTALQTALDAWQQGESVETLVQRRPSIYFNEPRCSPENRLVKYQLEDGHATHGQSVRLTARLTLGIKNAPPTERKVRYLIDTSPVVVIVAE